MKRIKTVRPKYQRRFTVIRWTIFLAMIFIFFIFMCTGNFIKPLLLIPMAVCISVNEDELISACTGVLCGLLTDIACDRLFGYNAIILAVSCTVVSLLFSNLLRRNIINVFILSSAITFIQGGIDYLLYYFIWSSEDVSVIYIDIILPSCIITSLSSLLIYSVIRAVRHKFTPERLQPLIDL
jgi:rod shape-determining protein MreD